SCYSCRTGWSAVCGGRSATARRCAVAARRETEMPENETLLRVSGVSKRFGGGRAVDNVDFDVRRGQVAGLIGPNGAGKTTLFSIIAGAEKPTSGEIVFEGRTIAGLRPNRIAHLGIARTFQIVRPLPRLTVFENVMVGAYCRVARKSSAREI